MSNEQAQSADAVTGKGTSLISGSLAELKKVTFPTRQETMQATLVTLFIIVFVSICLFLFDQVCFHLMANVVK